jgi:hypothetical protein
VVVYVHHLAARGAARTAAAEHNMADMMLTKVPGSFTERHFGVIRYVYWILARQPLPWHIQRNHKDSEWSYG